MDRIEKHCIFCYRKFSFKKKLHCALIQCLLKVRGNEKIMHGH